VQADGGAVRGELESVLEAGPAACGYEDQCWTLARRGPGVAAFRGGIHARRGARAAASDGGSVQVPAHRVAERDEAAVAAWKEQPRS
jgi:hypothetical protein